MAKITELVFTDIENTGLTFKPGLCQKFTDEVIEVAAARVNIFTREIVDKYETIIQPQPGGRQTTKIYQNAYTQPKTIWQLSDFHIKANHFADLDWDQGTTLKDALATLGERFFRPGATIAGQNPSYDLGHFQRDYEAMGMPFPELDYHIVDGASSAIFPYMYGETTSLSLNAMRTWAGAAGKQAHRAMGDVEDSIKVFFAMADRFKKGC